MDKLLRIYCFLFFLAVPFFASFNLCYAGGPLYIADDASPVIYPNSSITLHVENGDLGVLSNAIATTLLQEGADLWNEVSTSTINLSTDQSQIALDINDTNFETYMPTLDGTELNNTDNLNPVIFDDDGKIIEQIFGVGQTGLLGFAGSFINSETGKFIEGFILINGTVSGSNTKIKLTLTHEIGHFIGLDHSQANINNEESSSNLPLLCLTTESEDYPLMYPFVCRQVDNLHADDISAVSALYPSTNLNDTYGTLEGTFVDDSGEAILGANIWAEDTASGETYSIVSDYLKQDTGFYRLLLPAGTYTLHANSINSEFTAGSSVGPYANNSTDISFSAPHPITEITYFGSEEPGDEVITITTNEAVNISFSNIGARIISTSNASNGDDSIADLFGSLSHLTLFILALTVTLLRRLTMPQRTNHSSAN